MADVNLSISLSGSVNTIDGLKHLVSELEVQIKNGTRRTVAEAARLVHESVLNAIRETNSVASGNLLQSVTASGMLGSTSMFSVEVGSSSPYAIYVEEGRHAGSPPPVDAIFQWMVSKGLTPTFGAAYAVAQSIGERGIEPKRPFEKGLERAIPLIEGVEDGIMQSSLKDTK